MFVARKEWIRTVLTLIVLALCAFPLSLFAENTHVVSPADLRAKAVASSQVRQQDITKVQNFVSGPIATEALQRAHINPTQVKDAVPQLDNQELAQLAAKADRAQHDFAAGYLSTLDIALIIIGVALIILIIVVAS